MIGNFIVYTLSTLPIRDYRPYAVGKSIPEQMVLPEGAKESIYSNVFTYRDTVSNVVTDFYDTDGNTGKKEGYYLLGEDGNYSLIKLASGEVRKIDSRALATIGVLSNPYQKNIRIIFNPDESSYTVYVWYSMYGVYDWTHDWYPRI